MESTKGQVKFIWTGTIMLPIIILGSHKSIEVLHIKQLQSGFQLHIIMCFFPSLQYAGEMCCHFYLSVMCTFVYPLMCCFALKMAIDAEEALKAGHIEVYKRTIKKVKILNGVAIGLTIVLVASITGYAMWVNTQYRDYEVSEQL